MDERNIDKEIQRIANKAQQNRISAEALKQITEALGIVGTANKRYDYVPIPVSILSDKERGLRKRKRKQMKIARKRNR